MTGRWFTLFFFLLSILNPSPGNSQGSRKLGTAAPKTPEKSGIVNAKSKKNSAAKKRSESLTVQNQVSPDKTGKVITTVVGSGVGIPAGSIGYGSGSTGVGIPAAPRAAGESNTLILGYTPTAPVKATPAPSSNTGVQMAAALAGVLMGLFGGQKNQPTKASPPSQAGYPGPSGNAPRTQEQSSQTAAKENQNDGGTETDSVPETAKEPNLEPVKEEPVVPIAATSAEVPGTRSAGVEEPPAPKLDTLALGTSTCDAGAEGRQAERDKSFQMPLAPEKMEVTVCQRGSGPDDIAPLAWNMNSTQTEADKLENPRGTAGTLIGTSEPEAIYPVYPGIIKDLECKYSHCQILILHDRCPDAGQKKSCVSFYNHVRVTPELEKRLTRVRDTGQVVQPCQSLGKTHNWHPEVKDSAPAKNYSMFAIYPNGKPLCTLPPLVGFKDFDKWKTEFATLPIHRAGQSGVCKPKGAELQNKACSANAEPKPNPTLSNPLPATWFGGNR